MWIPEKEQDILTATANGSLEETLTFEAKKELPPKNKNSEIAKDASAMANTAGGVIIFGIGEDVSGRPTIPTPFELKGEREKIDNIIRTSVSEVPSYTISAIESQLDTTKGYLVLVIPPSERAPHMVIVNGERRYYGRGETGNYILSEPEVARLYERRNLARFDLTPILEEQIQNAPIKEHNGFIHLHIVIKPVLQDDSILEKAVGGFSIEYGGQVNEQILLNLLVEKVRESDVFPSDGYGQGFYSPNSWIHQPKSFLGKLASSYPNDETPSANTLQLEVGVDGSGHLFCGWIGRTIQKNEAKVFYPEFAASNLTRFIAFFGQLYKYAAYFGQVNIGVAFTGLEGCKGLAEHTHHLRFAYQYTDETYKNIQSFSAEFLAEKPKDVSAKLIMPFIKTLYQDTKFNPFAKT